MDNNLQECRVWLEAAGCHDVVARSLSSGYQLLHLVANNQKEKMIHKQLVAIAMVAAMSTLSTKHIRHRPHS